MKKTVVGKNLTLYFDKYFPAANKKRAFFKHIVLIGLGGNIGNVRKRFEKLYLFLEKDKRFHIVKSSPVLKNPPFGYTNQDDFFNSLLLIQTSMMPRELLKTLLHIEKRFGRVRSFKNAPRSLDLDIIFFDSLKLNGKRLTVPHPQWSQRESVLIPLAYLQ